MFPMDREYIIPYAVLNVVFFPVSTSETYR